MESRCEMADIEKKISEVNGTMAMEGLPLTDSDEEDMRAVLTGQISFEDITRKIIAEYKL
jgi:hypothetical protein